MIVSMYFNKIKIKINKTSHCYKSESQEMLTYPSGCNLTRKRFRLNEIFRILAHENVLIRVMPWNTAIPIWATAKLSGTPSISLAECIFMPYNSQRLAVSSKFKSASAGVWPLFHPREK